MALRTFLNIGIAEGFSSLLLFLVAMPLKYFMGIPEAVKYVGWAHGILFIAFGIAALMVGIERKWKFSSFVILFFAALLPGGPLYLDPVVLRREGEMA